MSLDKLETQLLQQQRQPAGIPRTFWLSALVFATLSLLASATSTGFLEADACTHYMAARFAFANPAKFVSVWDRPLFMLLYSIPAAWGGTVGARSMSLALALLCAFCGWRIARALEIHRPDLAFLFVLAQPLLFLHSTAEMTELCFAAVIALAFLAYIRRNWGWMALAVAISPLGRPEGFGFVLLAAMSLLLHRQWKFLVILPLPLLAWSFAGWWLWGRPDYGRGTLNFSLWLVRSWPYSGASVYESGPLLLWKRQAGGELAASFLLRLPMIISPLVFPFLILGVGKMLGGVKKKLTTHEGRCVLLAVGLPLGVLAGHSFLWWRGLMASSGELRYLLVVAPFWGVMAAAGWEWAFRHKQWRHMTAWAAGVALSPVLVNIAWGVVPFKAFEDDLLAADVAAWYRADPQLQRQYPRLTASYIAVYLQLDISTTDPRRTIMWGKQLVQQKTSGVIIVWDDVYGTYNADKSMCVSRNELIANGWHPIKSFTRGNRTWEAFAVSAARE